MTEGLACRSGGGGGYGCGGDGGGGGGASDGGGGGGSGGGCGVRCVFLARHASTSGHNRRAAVWG